ncbi:glycosyltransferase [Solitalea koreensis]|uniref:Glycosyltransferase, catalytic subunit of cellulose synthase and poly-beta-1,6-N-acetylglucosamine synthase n=1 Tax=Solitalea koreensis TaxID=543615 RepID=A0A521D8X2_9SPHI|nr:glycosyltransferase [Solitalea koreensis]SMO68154.1 Glycosyltransferase, catalytic subunit of cellulose synthase and poly-beta-1,6-N-acetylglucosamine synthase [Solitalea koreensis]
MPNLFTPTSIILLTVLAGAFIVNCAYLFFLYKKFAFNFPASTFYAEKQEPVSIVLCARNESENLRKFLPSLFKQDYPQFEVVVVNDCSFDDSEAVLEAFAEQYSNLKIVNLVEHEKYRHGKKFALTLGIKAAKYDLLLMTDADCEPVSEHWIASMQRNFTNETEIVLGYSPYAKTKGFLNSFIRFETFVTALNYFSFALVGKPYMGVGRNLAYRKELFFRNKGFAKHMHLLSGDDDLFVNENATKVNTRVEFDNVSQMVSEPKTTFKEYWTQKRRHQSVGKFYKPYHKRMLTMRILSVLLFYAVLITMIVLRTNFEIALSLFGLYLIFLTITYRFAMKKLNVGGIWPMAFFYELIHNLFLVFVTLFKLSPAKVKWK